MAEVTNGSVKYSRTKKDADFGINRTAEVSLSFNLGGEDDYSAFARTVGSQSIDIAEGMLANQGGVVVVPAATAKTAEVAPANDKDRLAAEATAAKPPRAPRAPRAPKPAEAVLTAGDPADVSEPAKPVVADPAATEDWDKPAAEIPDVELTGACSRAAKELGSSVPVRAIIDEFTGSKQKVVKDIPQPLRQAFLDKLEAAVKAKK